MLRRLIGAVFWMIVGGLIVLMAQKIEYVPTPKVQSVAPSPAPAKVALIIPVAGVAASALHSNFAEARADGARMHGAIDIAAPLGTPVIAAAAGTIEKIFESAEGGHTVYLRSPDRATVTYYAHLDTYAEGLREGMFVAQGAPIGTVGASGNADPAGPHLHFELEAMAPGEAWHQGRAVDPYPLLAGSAVGG